jgi:HPt (histidine-containing phosphotransfer) domain-containing protein
LYEAVEAIAPSTLPPDAPMPDEPQLADASDEVLDWNAALRRIGGRNELLEKIVTLFYPESDGLMNEIQAAIGAGDAVKLQRAAHTLKGSADCFCATAVVDAARRLEFMGRDALLTDADEAFAELKHALERLTAALNVRVPHKDNG